MVVGPDLGTAIVLVLTAAVLFYVAGLERRYIVVAAGGGAAAAAQLIVAEALPPGARGRLSSIRTTRSSTSINPGGQIRAYAKRSQGATRSDVSAEAVADRGGLRRSSRRRA